MTARSKKNETPEAAAAADPADSSATGSTTGAKAEIVRDLRAQLAALTGGMAPDDYLSAW